MPIARLLVLAIISGLGTVAVGAGLAQDMEVFTPPPNQPSDQGARAANRIPDDDVRGECDNGDEGDESEDGEGCQRPQGTPTTDGCIRVSQDNEICPPTETETAAVLLRDGPQASWNMAEGRFRVQGLVREDWPVAIDFLPEPNTRTMLRVRLFERGFFASGPHVDLLLDADGMSGRRLVVLDSIDLPRDDAAAASGTARPVRVATFQVRSRRLRPNGRPSGRRAPVQVYGIGVGPRAVGSLILTDLTLAGGASSLPLTQPVPMRIAYGFQLSQRFMLVRAELLRDCRGVFCRRVAATVDLNNALGRLGGRAPIQRPGTYRLSVRAWMDCNAADFTQCADQPAWTAGAAGPLDVQQ